MTEGLTTREAAKTDSAAQARDMRMEATLRIQWLADMRDMLSEMTDNLRVEADSEPDTNLAMRLELLRLETHRLAEDYNRELLRVSMTASLALEE